MVLIVKSPDTNEKLEILSRDSRYDLACACATGKNEHRRRSKEGNWIYPVTFTSGHTTFLFKTLLSNYCVNNCRYCPLRTGFDVRRLSIEPEKLAASFLSYYRAGKVSGLFLSSGVESNPDSTMERINRSALILRRSGFRGYIHLKIIPGASNAAVRQSLALASAVSLNIEAPDESNFKQLTTSKNYLTDIINPIKLISDLTAKGASYHGVKQTTQFVVGASQEKDIDIVGCMWRLYKGLGLSRVYFSAYQRQEKANYSASEPSGNKNADLLTREHRLYQVDWLIRKYGFRADEIPFEPGGDLSLTVDPKEAWAIKHPEFFPVNLNRDDKSRLLRIPGLGQVTVTRALEFRRRGIRIRAIADLGRETKLLRKAAKYITF